MTTQEQGLLVKMFANVSLVNFGDVHSSHKHARLRVWRNRIHEALAATRPIVLSWWNDLWELASPQHKKWSLAQPAQRMHVLCPSTVPQQYEWLDSYWRPHLFNTLPKRVQTKIRAEEEFGTTRTCAQLLFALLQDQGPGDLHDIDEITRHLRSPAPCTDPSAAQSELKRWWVSLTRANELGINLPDIKELYRACLSIFETVLSTHADQEVQHRWHNALMLSGGSRVQTFEALFALQQHALGELEFLITSGQRGASTALPLTDAQKQRKEQAAARAKAALNAAHGGGAATGEAVASMMRRPPEDEQKTKGVTSKVRNPDKRPCHAWQKGCCRQGHQCKFRHDSISSHNANGELVKRCFVCGEHGHIARYCQRPGGGRAGNADKRANSSKERNKKFANTGEASKPESPPRVAVICPSVVKFPPGAAAIDSGANVYLTHGTVPPGSSFKRSSLTLADGQHVSCMLGRGEKGVPQAIVPQRGEALDLLPLHWLCKRGCTFQWGDEPAITTPAGRVIVFGECQNLAFATREQVEQIFADLPDAFEIGRDGNHAASKLHASIAMSRLYVGRVNITENDAQPTTSAPTAPADPGAVALMVRRLPEPAVEATATESSQRGVLRRVLGKQSLVPVKVERLLKAYRQMPDEYHNHGDTPLSATNVFHETNVRT